MLMNTAKSPEIREVIESIHYRPSVSILMPFEPKMSVKAELTQQLKFAVDKVEKEIRQDYRDELATLVIQKLKAIIKNLNFSTYKKSIAIYVSPVFEKVLYLDIPIEQKVVVNGSFEIRDLLYAKKEASKYLALVVSAKHSRVYLGNASSFTKMKSNVPDHIAAFKNDSPERVANFSDPSYKKEVLLKKFLFHTDEGLKFLLQAYPLPVFIMGTKKILGYFKAMTKNEKSIVGYIHGNYEDENEVGLSRILKPYLSNWKKIKMEDLKHQMEKAADSGTLATGIRNVWKQASQHKGRLLIVEKNFKCTAQQGGKEDVIYMPVAPYNKFSYIKDAVDDVIEKVLEDGGDVEFVEEGMLKDHHISLIQYY
jgi:hypothetical protein